MTKSAWYCPFCNAHHAPHVDTCPNQNANRAVVSSLKVKVEDAEADVYFVGKSLASGARQRPSKVKR